LVAPRHLYLLGALGACACTAACGGKTHESAAAAHAPLDAGAERAATLISITPTDGGCYEPIELPVIATADQFGPNCTFVGMIGGGLYVECTASGVRTRIVAMLRPGVEANTYAHPVDPNVPLAFTLAAAQIPYAYGYGAPPCGPGSVHVALLCDGENCHVYDLEGETFMPAAVPPPPPGEWREISAGLPACSADGGLAQPDASFTSLWVRTGSPDRLAGWDGASWQVQSFSSLVPPPPPACLLESTTRNTGGWYPVGLTADGVVMEPFVGHCCPTTKPIAGAIDIVTFQCGEQMSLWVLTPTALRGTFDCGHD
jgi:hypothetical protein